MAAEQIVLITGASSGIGKAIGLHLLSKGYAVYGTTRNPNNYKDFTDFPLVQLDVREPESVQKCVQELMDKAGRIDVLVNNAGIGITGPVEETPLDEMQAVFETNFYGPLRLIQEVLPVMRSQNGGTIINITSIAGYMGLPFRGAYSASKGALSLMTESLRLETKGQGIRICSLAPGDFATNIAQGRYHAPVIEGSPYEKTYGFSLDRIDEDVDGASDPIAVGKQIEHILNTAQPKVHYPVGEFLQKFSIKLKGLLPGTWYEKLLAQHYKL
ncbi:SDR family oxidoreductase [Aureicoccus marinus]|uniref:Short-chain dehydrogenase/reductase n=1 Tax=Aureicoccus marinus TaxID=754435 RepID=A0A2S7T4Q2_9FLAO|nr:SDR family oxidoreductase [Aureicoccus marinus]PQJ14893.1 short-chain dehydrogenase/reductase [Aureicoccus marinus]